MILEGAMVLQANVTLQRLTLDGLGARTLDISEHATLDRRFDRQAGGGPGSVHGDRPDPT